MDLRNQRFGRAETRFGLTGAMEEAACEHLQRHVCLLTDIHPGQGEKSETEHLQQDPCSGQGQGRGCFPKFWRALC